MKTLKNRMKLILLLLMFAGPAIVWSQGGLTGNLKYIFPGGK